VSAAEWEIVDQQRSAKPHEAGRATVDSSSSMSRRQNSPIMISLVEAALEMAIGQPVRAISNTSSKLLNLELSLPSTAAAKPSIGASPALEHYLREAVTVAHGAINNLIAPLPNGAALADRLHELVDFARDEYPETDIPSHTSIATLGRFFSGYPGIVAPELSLLPSGSLWLSWKKPGANSGLSIFRDGSMSFGLVVSGSGRPTHVNFAGTMHSVVPRIVREEATRGLIT
jgi:hypothetical protein